jgi:hypothetical protein
MTIHMKAMLQLKSKKSEDELLHIYSSVVMDSAVVLLAMFGAERNVVQILRPCPVQ